MNKKEYVSIDELIKRTLNDKVQKETDVDVDNAWEKFRSKYPVSKKKSSLRVWAIACSIFLLLGTSLLVVPSDARALSIKFLENIKVFIAGKSQVTHTTFSSESSIEQNTEFSLPSEKSRALESVSYNPLLPIDTLGTYEITNIEVVEVASSQEILLFLKGSGSENIIISQINLVDNFYHGVTYDTDDAVEKVVNIKGQEGKMLVYKDGHTTVSWIDRDTIYISISGDISEEDILPLANSMRSIN